MKIRLQKRLQKRVIERLIELHMLNLSKIDVNVRNNSLAIYLLQGALITSTINASKLDAEVGMLGREWRYMVETTYAITFFDELPPDDRRIKAWFEKDGYPERPIKKGKPETETREKLTGVNKEMIERYDELHRTVNGMLSAFAHPTYKSAIGNTRSKSRQVDYYQREQKNNPASLTALRGIFVAEALSGILYPVNTLPLETGHVIELMEYRQQLETDFRKYL